MKSLLAFAALAVAAAPAFADGPRYLLDVEGANPGKEIVLNRPPDGLVPIQVILNAPLSDAHQPVRLSMSQFAGDRGSFPVQIRAACDSTDGVQSLDFTKSTAQGICLYIPPLPGDGRYTGSMLLVSPEPQALVKPFVITRPQAVLAVQPIAPQLVTLSPWGRFVRDKTRNPSAAPQQTFRVILSEKSGLVDAKGIMVKLSVSKSPANFDLKKNIAFRIDGCEIPCLDSGPIADSPALRLRSVPAGGQLGIDVALYGLKPGEYNAVLQFSSLNSAADDSQKQSLVIQVRDPVWSAVLCLLVALVMSFFGTKVVVGLRWRAAAQQRIEAVSPQWFARLPPMLAVVWVRAVLHQAKALSRGIWLTGTNLIDEQIDGVRDVVRLLDQAHQLCDRLNRAGLDVYLLRRILLDVQKVESRLDAGPPDPATIARIQADLAAFEDWLGTDDKKLGRFTREVIPDIKRLVGEVEAVVKTGHAAAMSNDTITKLRADINGELESPLQTPDDMSRLYRDYARLGAFWSARKNQEEFEKELHEFPDLEEMLRIVDYFDWLILNDAATKCEVHSPENDNFDAPEAYVPLQFSVEANNPAYPQLAQSYLFRNRVEYAWTFTLNPAAGRLRAWLRDLWRTRQHLPSGQKTFEAVSHGPSMVCYFPSGGEAEVEVALKYLGNDPLNLPAKTFAIRKSNDYGIERLWHPFARESGSDRLGDRGPCGHRQRPLDVLLQGSSLWLRAGLPRTLHVGRRDRSNQELRPKHASVLAIVLAAAGAANAALSATFIAVAAAAR
jgi:hypothetical protein